MEDSNLSTSSGAPEDSEEIILEAVRAIVKATKSHGEASLAVELLRKELNKSLNNSEEGDPPLKYPDSDDDEDIETIRKEGRIVAEKHKKTESDKWRELLVFLCEAKLMMDDRPRKKGPNGRIH
jgi:hypothetical protein